MNIDPGRCWKITTSTSTTGDFQGLCQFTRGYTSISHGFPIIFPFSYGFSYGLPGITQKISNFRDFAGRSHGTGSAQSRASKRWHRCRQAEGSGALIKEVLTGCVNVYTHTHTHVYMYIYTQYMHVYVYVYVFFVGHLRILVARMQRYQSQWRVIRHHVFAGLNPGRQDSKFIGKGIRKRIRARQVKRQDIYICITA